jgi:hypothetical protein
MKLTTDIFESIQLAKSKWNADADEWNQWEDLCRDEKIDLVTEELRDHIYEVLKQLGEAE